MLKHLLECEERGMEDQLSHSVDILHSRCASHKVSFILYNLESHKLINNIQLVLVYYGRCWWTEMDKYIVLSIS